VIGIAAEEVGIAVQQPLAADVLFYDERVVVEAQRIEPLVNAKWTETRDGSPECALADRSARIVAVYATEAEALRKVCVDRVMAADSAQIKRATEKINAGGKGPIREMLRTMNDWRYKNIFQSVFALCPLREVR
jgi:hypothetical protein